MADRLDIFEVLRHINGKDVDWYENLSADQQKLFVPYLSLMWMSFSNLDIQVDLLNDFVNRYTFSLYKHPQLLYNLLTVCATGNANDRVQYRKKVTSKDKKPISVRVLSEYYGISEREATNYLTIITIDDLVEMASAVGLEKTEVTSLKKEHK